MYLCVFIIYKYILTHICFIKNMRSSYFSNLVDFQNKHPSSFVSTQVMQHWFLESTAVLNYIWVWFLFQKKEPITFWVQLQCTQKEPITYPVTCNRECNEESVLKTEYYTSLYKCRTYWNGRTLFSKKPFGLDR